MDKSGVTLIHDNNDYISALQTVSQEEERNKILVTENEIQNKKHDQIDKTAKRHPLNISGKRVYDREFLIDLCNDSNSYMKPSNLPDLEIVLIHDVVSLKQRNLKILQNFKDVKEYENEEPDQISTTTKGTLLLKYTYEADQWSPLNRSGKKVYDREFLIKLQSDPNSKIKPLNLPDLEVVLKDNSKRVYDREFLIKLQSNPNSNIRPCNLPDVTAVVKKNSGNNRVSMHLRQFNDSQWRPQFVKSLQSARRSLTPKRGSQQGKPKSNKLVVTQALSSAKEDIKLRESENPWRPSLLKFDDAIKKNIPSDGLYKTVRRVLNKLVPQNFNKLVKQVKTLRINSQEELQGVVNLVFEKAIKEPRFMAVYARMCKELAMIQVSSTENEAGKLENDVNFRKFIITRCVMEFEEAVDENSRVIQRNEIEAITNPKADHLQVLTKQERINRTTSFGIIRFIGELFKQEVLTTFIMHRCIRHLLTQIDDESSDCLCKLLITVGKDLELKNQNLDPYFEQMVDIVNRKVPGVVSSRARIMLQDVIELRTNKWIPREGYNNSEMDQIKIEDDSGGAQPLGSQTRYLVETSELKIKPPPMDNLHIGNKNMLQLTGVVSVDATRTVKPNKSSTSESISIQQNKCMVLPISGFLSTGLRDPGGPAHGTLCFSKPPSLPSKKRLAKKSTIILEDYLANANIDTAAEKIHETFDDSTFANFVREALSKVVNKSPTARIQVSQLITHLISKNILKSSVYLSSLGEVLDASGDVVIDVSKIWVFLAELIWYPLAEGVYPFSELKTMMAPLKNKGLAGILMGELMTVLVREKSLEWIKVKWDRSGLEWDDFLQENESLDNFIMKYKLEFLLNDSNSSSCSSSELLNMEQIHKRLLCLVSNDKKNSFQQICSWISVNVGEKASKPEFIKVLMTIILEASIDVDNDNTWQFRADKFRKLQNLIPRYIDVNIKVSELQCLLAIQEYIHQVDQPQRVLLEILEKQIYESILSFDVYHVWESNRDLTPPTGKSIAMLAVKSFFTSFKETNIIIPNPLLT